MQLAALNVPAFRFPVLPVPEAVKTTAALPAAPIPSSAAQRAQYPAAGEEWTAKSPSRDFSVFGVTGTTTVVGTTSVKVPAGRFTALVVRSTLKQEGFAFGSGTRTAYFAAGRGLVKLVFKHGDRSTSVVELLK